MIGPPEVLTASHKLETFDCGSPSIDRWLRNRALNDQQERKCVVVVSHEDTRAVGFYALAQMRVEASPTTMLRQTAPMPALSALFISRLATDQEYSGRGVASTLLRHALLRAVLLRRWLPDLAPALMVHGLDDQGAAFWAKWGFIEVPSSPYHLFRPIHDIAAQLEAANMI